MPIERQLGPEFGMLRNWHAALNARQRGCCMSFIAELKRRNVIRMAGLYLVGAWLVIQVSSTVLPAFDVPGWMLRALISVLAIGFVPALVFSWIFELTPAGIKRDDEVPREESIAPLTARKMNRAIIAVLTLALLYFGFDKFVLTPRREESQIALATKAAVQQAVSASNNKSIAVLPFVNMSGDANNDYFSDGITEEILNALAQVPNLKVAARTSAFAFKGKEEDLRKVGEVLGVATVLEGSVQKSGDEVRITAQLIDTRSGYHLWSEKYDRKLTNIFAIEDEISKAITDKLRLQWSNDAPQSLPDRKAVDSRAHDFYLRGLPLIAARGPGLREAVADFQQAVAIDPDYAQAWAALAEAQILLPHYFLAPQETAFPSGEAAANRALAIDPDTAAAHVALAMMYRIQWKWKEADDAFQRALKITPGDAEAADQYAQFLLAEGRLSDALTQIDHAQRLDPLSGIIGATRTNVLTALHRFDDANTQAQAVVSGHPDYALGHFIAADVAIYRGEYSSSKEQFRTAAALVGENADVYVLLVNAIADPAQRPTARRAILAAANDTHQRLSAPAKIKWLMLLGEHDDALDELQRIGHDVMFGQDNVWQPAFDPVRGDPRFKMALKRMGLAAPPQGKIPR
jgi:TolB-like protein/Tfp pilus assembly protein PilF